MRSASSPLRTIVSPAAKRIGSSSFSKLSICSGESPRQIGCAASGSGPALQARATALAEQLVLGPLERGVEAPGTSRAASAPRGRGPPRAAAPGAGGAARSRARAAGRARASSRSRPESSAPAPDATRVTRFRSTIAIVGGRGVLEDLPRHGLDRRRRRRRPGARRCARDRPAPPSAAPSAGVRWRFERTPPRS